MNRNFTLTKWYFDLVDANGRGIIGYDVTLTWGKVSMGFEGCIQFNTKGESIEFKKFRKTKISQQKNYNELAFKNTYANGTWRIKALGFEEDLLLSKEGDIKWHCVQPKANVEVTLNDKSKLIG